MTEKELIEIQIAHLQGQIKVLQSKLEFYKELERTKTPCEEAFKRIYKVYPSSTEKSVFWTDTDEVTWIAFQKGYEESQKDYKVGEFQEPVKKKSLYQFLAEWKYGIEEGDIIPQFDNDEFSVLDWSQIFIEYLYECGDIISEVKDEIVIKLKQTQLEIPND